MGEEQERGEDSAVSFGGKRDGSGELLRPIADAVLVDSRNSLPNNLSHAENDDRQVNFIFIYLFINLFYIL